MKKIFTKLIGATLGLAMVIGVGVGVASNVNKEAKPVHAEGEHFASTTETFKLASAISNGDEIIIAAKNYNHAMGVQGTNIRGVGAITKSQDGNTASVDAEDTVVLLTVGTDSISETEYFTFNDGSGYLNNNSQTKSGSNQNYLTTVNDLDTESGKTHWTVTITDGVASLVSLGQRVGTGRYTMSYNYNSGSNQRFSCYTGIQTSSQIGGQLVIYKNTTTVSLDRTEVTIPVGSNSTLVATTDTIGDTISWKSSNISVAMVSNGVVTGESAGSATITAFIDSDSDGVVDDGEPKATCAVTITADAVHATSVSIVGDTSGTLVEGQTVDLDAVVEPNNSTDSVVWSSSSNSIATVDENGLVTAVSAGNAIITATAGLQTAQYTLTVNALNALTNYPGAIIDKTGQLMFKYYRNALVDDGAAAYWIYATQNISNELSVGDLVRVQGTSENYDNKGGIRVSNATVTSADSGSVVPSSIQALTELQAEQYISDFETSPANVVPHKKVSLRTGEIGDGNTWLYGNAPMKTYISNGGMVAGRIYDIEGYLMNFNTSGSTSLCICVTQANAVQIDATGIELDNEQIGLAIGANTTLTPTLSPAGATGSISWSSSDDDVATVENGVVTAHALGSATITATVNGHSDTCVVNVVYQNKTNLLPATSVSVGDTVYLAASEASKQYNGISTTSTKYGLGVEYINAPNKNIEAFEITAGNGGTNFAFKLKNSSPTKYLTWEAGNTLNVNESMSDNTSWTITIDGEGNATIKNVKDDTRVMWWNNTSPRFACYAGQSHDGTYKYVQLWKDTLSASSVATVDKPDSMAVLRFGAIVQEADWSDISDYGVLLVKETTLTTTYSKASVIDAYRAGKTLANISNGSGNVYTENGKCYFHVGININDGNNNTVYCALPYVVKNGVCYFFDEMRFSVKTLAEYCKNHPGTSPLGVDVLTTLAA